MVPNNALTSSSSNRGAASHSHESRNGQVTVLFNHRHTLVALVPILTPYPYICES